CLSPSGIDAYTPSGLAGPTGTVLPHCVPTSTAPAPVASTLISSTDCVAVPLDAPSPEPPSPLPHAATVVIAAAAARPTRAGRLRSRRHVALSITALLRRAA